VVLKSSKMTKTSSVLLVFLVVLISAFRTSDPELDPISPKSKVNFSSKNASGYFEGISGQIMFDEKNLEAGSFDITIDVASIHTGQKLKDKHAKGEDWFDATNYPSITFKSIGSSRVGNEYQTTGQLKIKDVERTATVHFSHSNGIFKGQFQVNRTDFGVGSMKGMQKHVDDLILVDFELVVES
jgi:polyisoprenoid-binding protein YceI